MHTVCELASFQRAAKAAGMSAEEVQDLVDYLGANPAAGDEIPGTGGCRKLRVARPGAGKRGGYRTITFYSGVDIPVFLVTVFTKGERSDLSQAERNQLAGMTKRIVDEYKTKVVRARTKR